MIRTVLISIFICGLSILTGCTNLQETKARGTRYLETETGRWLVHDMNRPAPPIITPGTDSTQEQPGKAPSDAIVLFDGTDLSGWTSERGGQAR